MGYQTIEDLNEVRRRRLDELFADEPHLSPTMKASRLHERLDEPDAALTHIAIRRDDVAELREANWLDTVIDRCEPTPVPRWHPTPSAPPAASSLPTQDILRVEILLDTSVSPARVQAVHALSDGPDVLRLREAAAYLRVGVDRVREWVRSGRLPCARIGRQYRFRRAALAAFLADME